MPGKKTATADFSLQDTIIDSLKQEFPIPGQHNLKKVGHKKIANTDGLLHREETIEEKYSANYKTREEFEEAFNNHPFNRIFKFRNLMSGKQDITWRTLFKNAARDMAGFHEELAPKSQKIVNYAGSAFFGVKPILTFAWSLSKKVANLVLDIVKLPTVVLPSILYKLSYQGMMSAADQIKKIQKHIDKTNTSGGGTMLESLEGANLSAFGAHLADRAKIAGLSLLVAGAAVAFGITRAWHFIANAALAPRENFRLFWNDKNADGKATVSGKILAVLSIITSIAVYTAAAFFFAPLAMEGLTALSLATAGTPFGTLVSGLVTGISTVANALAVVTAPIGAALTTALESIAAFLPFLAPAALAAGNIAPATLGLLTLAGTAVAVVGTGESIAQGAVSDKYHSYALEKAIRKDAASTTVAVWKGLTGEKTPLIRSRSSSRSDAEAKNDANQVPLEADAEKTAREEEARRLDAARQAATDSTKVDLDESTRAASPSRSRSNSGSSF